MSAAWGGEPPTEVTLCEDTTTSESAGRARQGMQGSYSPDPGTRGSSPELSGYM